MKDSVSGPTRQHHTMAVGGETTPAPGGAPTSDVFQGKGGAQGSVHGPGDGESRPADESAPRPADGLRW